MRRIFKIIGLYAIGIAGLSLYFFLSNSLGVTEFLQKAERSRTDWSFEVFVWVTLIDNLLPIAGIAVILITTFLLIKKHTTLLSRFYKD